MKYDDLSLLSHYAESFHRPGNYYSGQRLPDHFALPDNILVFFHDFILPTPHSNSRNTFVFPFDPMTYHVSRQHIPLTPGSLLFIPPHAMRFLHPDSVGYRRLFITFDNLGKQDYLPRPGICDLSTETWRFLRRFLKQYQAENPIECAVELMRFSSMLRTTSPLSKEESHLSSPVEKSIEFIESHLASGIGLKEIATKVGLSESHLRMRFRKEMGISLGHFLARKRLDAAQYQLLHSDMTLAEIAAACGFANVFVFGAFFKKNTGISPLRFRKANRISET